MEASALRGARSLSNGLSRWLDLPLACSNSHTSSNLASARHPYLDPPLVCSNIHINSNLGLRLQDPYRWFWGLPVRFQRRHRCKCNNVHPWGSFLQEPYLLTRVDPCLRGMSLPVDHDHQRQHQHRHQHTHQTRRPGVCLREPLLLILTSLCLPDMCSLVDHRSNRACNGHQLLSLG
jgi:hypothetical protein